MQNLSGAISLLSLIVSVCPSLAIAPVSIWLIARAKKQPNALVYTGTVLHVVIAIGFIIAVAVYWNFYGNCTACINGMIIYVHLSIAAGICWLLAVIATIFMAAGWHASNSAT